MPASTSTKTRPEPEALAVIEAVATRLTASFPGGIHGPGDVRHLARMEAAIVLAGWQYLDEDHLLSTVCHRLVEAQRDPVGCLGCYRAWLRGSSRACGRHTASCTRFASWKATQKRRWCTCST